MRTSRQLDDQPLLPSEAATLLGITEQRLLVEASRGVVPGVCLGGVWRFSLAKITQHRNTGLQVHALAAAHL